MFRIADKLDSRLGIPYVESLLFFDMKRGFMRFLGHYNRENVLPHRTIFRLSAVQELTIDILSYTESPVNNVFEPDEGTEEEWIIDFTPVYDIEMYFRVIS